MSQSGSKFACWRQKEYTPKMGLEQGAIELITSHRIMMFEDDFELFAAGLKKAISFLLKMEVA